MSLREQIYTQAIWPFADPSCRGMAQAGARLRRRERATLAENQDEQWNALGRLLRHAWDTSPFYRRRFEAVGLHPDDVRRPQDLERLPVLTRDDLRRYLGEICSRSYAAGDLLTAATGGTTDTPVPLRRDPACIAVKKAIQHSFWNWAGARAGDRVFWLWGAASDFAQSPSWRRRLFDRYVMRQAWAPVGRLDAAVMERHRLAALALRPRVICSYPSPLYIFCRYLRDCGRPFHRPALAICTAEMLLPQHRALIEEVLQCEVFEHYGSRDFGMIASECEAHQGFHLHPAAAYVETRAVGPGPGMEKNAAPRELLVTDLNNYGMPLIRYQINDCVQAEAPAGACACGRGFPRLPPIAGRTTDIFRLPDGSFIPGVALTNRILKVSPQLAKTQIIQEALGEFRLRYVPGPGFAAAHLGELRQKLLEFFPSNVRWEFEATPDIAREPSGKTHFCVCKLSAAELAA